MKFNKIVVTGMGALTPVGLNVSDSWQAILAGKSGVTRLDDFLETEQLSSKIGGLVKNFDESAYFNGKEGRKLDNFIKYGIAAAEEAIADSGLTVTDAIAHRVGVALGAGIGGLPAISKNVLAMDKGGPRKVSPFFIPGAIVNMLPGMLSMRHNLKGPNISIVTACTTGAHNIGYAARAIAYGDADVMIAGGAEQACCMVGMSGFASMRALSKRNDEPESASRPFDKDRDGFVLSDGAGVLVLESEAHAIARGATIYAELTGFGASADAYHMTMPAPEGAGGAQAMKSALADAELNPEAVGYVNAHATSTPAGDELEIQAIKNAFGTHASDISVSSTKSMTGHCLGAAGAIEAIFSILALRDQVLPPTINLENPSENCDLDLVPNQAREKVLKAVLSNSFGFGGTNGSLIFTPY